MPRYWATILIVRKVSRVCVRGLREKHVAAIVLSIIGGLLNIGMLRNVLSNTPWGILNAFWPMIPLVGGMMLYLSPEHHRIWGALVLGFCVASWVLLGSLLGDIAGILAITWKPRTSVKLTASKMPSYTDELRSHENSRLSVLS
jgi:hypothetical protein